MKPLNIGIAVCLSLGAAGAQAETFLEIINASQTRTVLAPGEGSTLQPQDAVVGRLRYVVDVRPGESAFMTFTVLGGPRLPSDPSFGLTQGTPNLGGTVFSQQVTAGGLANFSFTRADGAAIGNFNNASWQDMNFAVVLNPDRMSGRLLLEDALLGSDFDYNDLTVRFQMRVAPVPEPSTYALALAGLGLVGWSTRRSRRRLNDADGAANTLDRG